MGGDRLWADRFIGYHAAVVYYWMLVLLYMVAPGASYKFSELLETHAVCTYSEWRMGST